VNIILFGAPGSGKGTQAEKIKKKFNLFKVSTGDLLRDEIEKQSALGQEIKKIIEKGLFVTDNIVFDLIEKIISNKDYKNKLIFDGYPRNINQSHTLEKLLSKYNQKIACVLCLKVDENNIVKRILGRQICSKCGSIFNEYFMAPDKKNHSCDAKFLKKRSDDNEKVIKNRLEVYTKDTLPLLKHYKNQKIMHEIDGMRNIDDIYEEILSIIQPLDTWLFDVYLYKWRF